MARAWKLMSLRDILLSINQNSRDETKVIQITTQDLKESTRRFLPESIANAPSYGVDGRKMM